VSRPVPLPPVAGRKETRVALSIHQATITAYLRLGLPLRVNLYTSTIYRKMGKGSYGIASH